MKEGWKYKKLGEICRVINGRAYSKDEMLNQGKYRLLRVGNFFTNDSWYYSDLELEEDKYCDNGDLLYAWSASFGPRIWDGEKVIYHYHIWKMVCSEEIDKHFLCYWLDSDELKKQTMTSLHGATMAHITKRIIENAIVSYPPLSEQQSIVDYLDSAFAKIDAMKANAEKALNEAKALFQASLKEMLEPKEGWEEKTLKEISVISGNYGLSVPSTEYNGVRYLRITDITEWGELNDEKVSAKVDNENEQELLEEGDILFARTGATVGKTLMYKEDFGKCLFAGYLIRYRLNKKLVLPKYMFYITHSSNYYKWIIENQKAAAQPNISAKLYNEYIVSFPSILEQQTIVEALDSLKSKVDHLQENFDKISKECDALKQAILRQVFE